MLQVCDAVARLITALHFGDLASAPNSPETAVWFKRNLKQRTSTEKFSLVSCSEQVMGNEQEVRVFESQAKKESEKAIEAQQESLELEEAQFHKSLRVHLSSAASGSHARAKAKEKRPLSQETHFQGYLRRLNTVGKSLRALGVKKRLATNKSLGDFSVSLHYFGSPSYHPAKSASLSFSGSTTASRRQPRA